MADPGLLLVALAILVASILAKGRACWAAARLTGQDNPTAPGIGARMNARGLMVSPLFALVYGRRARQRGDLGALRDEQASDQAVGTAGRSAHSPGSAGTTRFTHSWLSMMVDGTGRPRESRAG